MAVVLVRKSLIIETLFAPVENLLIERLRIWMLER
jgi:hypothetical protein